MLKIGIIGAGFGLHGLLPAFNSTKNCKVVAISYRKSQSLVTHHKHISQIDVYSDWRKLLTHKNLDAIALAVPPNVQYQIARAAIKKGLHIFAEKPLASNESQAGQLLNLARKSKITHCVDFIFPEIAEWKKVKVLLDKKTFGELKHISVNWDWLSGDIKNNKSSWKTNIAEGGGALAFYFSHGLHYLEHFAGRISDMKSLFTHSKKSLQGAEVGVDLLLKFNRNISGYAHVSCNSIGLIRHKLKFQCQKGVIVLENKNAIVDKFTIKTYTLNGHKQLVVKPDIGKKNDDERVKIVRKLTDKFIKACISKQQMSPSFKEGLRVQELINAVRAAEI